MRKPFQGLLNVIRFNWGQYLVACAALLVLILLVSSPFGTLLNSLILITIIYTSFTVLASLFVSWLVYDNSGFYHLDWLETHISDTKNHLVNLHSGFDETSELIKQKFPQTSVSILDFYNPQKHTEPSIRRARKIYPPDPDTIRVSTQELPFPNDSEELVLCSFALHEIRSQEEREECLCEIYRTLKKGGKLIVVEHLRDLPNFVAFSIGFLHFHSKTSWKTAFQKAGFHLSKEEKFTPYVSIFTLTKL